jgi:cell division protein FtsW
MLSEATYSRKWWEKLPRQRNSSRLADSRSRSAKSQVDIILLAAVGLLLPVGILMVYSSSNAVSREYFDNSYHFFEMQTLWCCIGLMIMLFTAFFNYRTYQRLAWLILLISGILLLLVYIPGMGVKHGGSVRRLGIGRFRFQPVEFAKLGIIIYVAQFLNRKKDYIGNFKRAILPSLIVLVIFFALIYKQPDFGSLVIIGLVVFAMLFVGGARVYQMALLMIAAGILIAIGIWMAPYRLVRWTTFLHPWKDAEGAGYHIIQSFYALGSGGILGVGLGNGMQKLHYLPTPHTDFIFAVIGEELGFLGSFSIVLLFMVIVWRGIRISLSTRERFGSLLAFGIAFLIGIQAFVNIAVVTGTLPTKGLTLPFVSFGGSSMLVSLASVGILLNISRNKPLENNLQSRGIKFASPAGE